MKGTVVVLQTRNPSFARASFLTDSWQVVESFLENAFIFEGVLWHRVDNLVKVGKNRPLHSLVEQYSGTWESFFTEKFKYTLLPFDVLPSPLGFQYSRTDIQRLARTAITKNVRTNAATWEAKAGAILLDKLDSVRLKFKGQIFTSPCEACQSFFGHLAGQCQLLKADSRSPYNYRVKVKLCHMPLFERSDALPEDGEASSPEMGPVTLD